MGLFDFVKNQVAGQLVDVIEWTDDSQDTLVHKYDMNGKEIMMGAQLTVRESQQAIFVNEGQLADIFAPGRYELQTSNMPIMTKLKAWKFGFNSPFKSDVYYVSTRQFMDRKWGTTNPVMMRDADFGMIRVRAFGTYSFHVVNAEALLKECFGTNKVYRASDIDGQIKKMCVSTLSDAIAESKIPALDIAANYDELGNYAMQMINAKLEQLGIELTAFVIENVSLPEEVEKAMDRRTSMGVVGDLNKYTQFQAAEALRESANNPSGNAGAAMGIGSGMAMGQMFMNTLNQGMMGQQQAAPAAAPAAPAAKAFCSECGGAIAVGSKFCPHCGAKQEAAANVCPGCGAQVKAGAKFCTECGTKLG